MHLEFVGLARPCPCLLLRAVWATAAFMSAIYEKNKDPDGFLYVTYSGENTFGDCLEEL